MNPTDVPLYVPPDDEVVKGYARDVCAVLVQRGQPEFGKAEVVSGLAEFLIFVARLVARRLNEGRGGSV